MQSFNQLCVLTKEDSVILMSVENNKRRLQKYYK